MKKNKIIYWITTGVISFMMLFSAYMYLSNPDIEANFHRLGFPTYFMIELAIAKIIGVVILLLPMLPVRYKEWAYAGFGITFISAFIAHTVNGDPTSARVMPLVMLGILIVSNIYLQKIRK